MKTVIRVKGGFRFFYWFIDLLALSIALTALYLIWTFAPMAYAKAKEHFQPVIPEGLINVDQMDGFCPEHSTVLKEMYYYDHISGKKRKLLVGSKEMIKNALTVMKDKDTVMTHDCMYY